MGTIDSGGIIKGAGGAAETAAQTPFTPTGELSAEFVQAALEELDAEKAAATTVAADLTASVTQTQAGGTAITTDVAEFATVATANDAATLDAATAGKQRTVINNGANTMQVFPATGEDLGQGVNASTTIAAGASKTFVCVIADEWEEVSGGGVAYGPGGGTQDRINVPDAGGNLVDTNLQIVLGNLAWSINTGYNINFATNRLTITSPVFVNLAGSSGVNVTVGNFAIGFESAARKLHVRFPGAPQQRWDYDAANYAEREVDLNGNITDSLTGTLHRIAVDGVTTNFDFHRPDAARGELLTSQPNVSLRTTGIGFCELRPNNQSGIRSRSTGVNELFGDVWINRLSGSTALARFHVEDGTGQKQQRWSYDGTNYAEREVNSSGNVTESCSGGLFTFADDVALATKTPASATATGTTGTIAWDAGYIYVCTATNTWKRVAIATW